MANIQLNTRANQYINEDFKNDLKAQKLVRATIIRYSKDGSFCQKLKNFFLSIFCSSDWQKTKRLLRKKELRNIKIKLLQREGGKTKQYKETMSKIKKQTKSLLDTEHEYLLKDFVSLQNNVVNPELETKVRNCYDKFKDKVRKIDPQLVA